MITLTLEVTPKQMLNIAKVLNPSSESISEPSRPEKTPEDKVFITNPKKPSETIIAQPAKSPGKQTKMPSFGRTQQQVDSYVESEESRLEIAEEEAQLKAERKLQKEQEEAAKEVEVAEIKQETADITTDLPIRKPWEL